MQKSRKFWKCWIHLEKSISQMAKWIQMDPNVTNRTIWIMQRAIMVEPLLQIKPLAAVTIQTLESCGCHLQAVRHFKMHKWQQLLPHRFATAFVVFFTVPGGAIRRKRARSFQTQSGWPQTCCYRQKQVTVSLQTLIWLICTLPKPRTINTYQYLHKKSCGPRFFAPPCPLPRAHCWLYEQRKWKHGWSQPQHCSTGHVCLRKVGNPLAAKVTNTRPA